MICSCDKYYEDPLLINQNKNKNRNIPISKISTDNGRRNKTN